MLTEHARYLIIAIHFHLLGETVFELLAVSATFRACLGEYSALNWMLWFQTQPFAALGKLDKFIKNNSNSKNDDSL